MQRLFTTYGRLLASVETCFVRYLYEQIDWSNRLIVIKGAKGVGKTTMLLQHIRRTFNDPQKALYASADHIWFASHSLLDLSEYHYTHGGTHLFIDEIHKYPNWEREVKNIYDSFPQLHLVITGSSMLRLEESLVADLSRRARQYELVGLSFREYLKLEGVADLPVLTLDEILASHFNIAQQITSQIRILPCFEKYLQCGYYPFYREEGDGFDMRILQVIDTILESEIPAVSDVEYETVYKAKALLAVLAERGPYTLNVSNLMATLTISRNSLLKLFELMDKAALIRRLYSSDNGMPRLAKPEKILFDNTNIMYALSPNADSGTMRETYFASQMALQHSIFMPDMGDLVVNGRYLFEIGGKGKKFSQIKDIEHSFVVADGIESGFGNKIPLWMFGFLY